MVTRTSSHVSTPKKVEHGTIGSRPPAYSAAAVVDSAIVTPPRGAMNVSSMVNDSSCNPANVISGKKKHQFSILSKSLRKAFQKGANSGGSVSVESTSPSNKANSPDGNPHQQSLLTSPEPGKKPSKSLINKENSKHNVEGNTSTYKTTSDGVDVALVTPPPPTVSTCEIVQ